MSAALKLPVQMTVPEFLEWDPGNELRYELVDGAPRAMAPPSTIHALLQGELGSLIRNHLREHRPACRMFINPGVLPSLFSSRNLRVPDVGVTCSPVVPGQSFLSNPVLLIEILSPSNRPETWSNVWAYTSIPSVREILVLHGARITAEILSRGTDDQWPQDPIMITGGDLVLESIGLRTPLRDIYAGTGLVG